MTREGARYLAVWGLAMLAGLAIVWHSRFTADMSFFLPLRPSPEQEVIVQQLKDGVASRLLMVAIEGGQPAQRAEVSRELRARLMRSGAFVSVQNGEAASQDADRDYLFRHRYLLSPAVTAERFTVEGLRQAIAGSIDLLASSAGGVLKPLLTRDPTGELWAQLASLDPGRQPATQDGVWASRDGQRALLLLQTRAQGSDTDGQLRAIEGIRSEFGQVSAQLPELRLQIAGPGVFAVHARETIHAEVTRLSLLGTLAIVAVLGFVYRSARLVLLGLLPVASGALAGIVAVSLAYGTVFGITVGFGSALIGEAVDYSIYYFVQSGRIGLAAWSERFWPTVRLGVLTSVAGFGALLFSSFPGLVQLGLYSMAGILTAALVTRFLLPRMAGAASPVRDLTGLGRALAGIGRGLRGKRWLALVAAALALAWLVVQRDSLWQGNISVLSTADPQDVRTDQALRSEISAPDARFMVVVSAPDREQALQGAERAGRQLDRLMEAGLVGGYDSPARFLPSQATQGRRQAALPPDDELARRLALAQADSPLAAARLAPFLAEVSAARSQPLVDRSNLDGAALALAVDALLVPRPGGGWSVLLPLHPPPGGEFAGGAAAVREALAGSGALFIDLKAELNGLYAGYLHEAMLLSLAGLAAIVVLLAATLRSLRRLARVLLPLALAVLLVMAGLTALGETLHLLHLVGMLLIVAVGSNYALFFECNAEHGDLELSTLASMVIANVATVIGFGVLGLSSVPVLHAIGVTVGPGAALALILSAAFLGREAEPS